MGSTAHSNITGLPPRLAGQEIKSQRAADAESGRIPPRQPSQQGPSLLRRHHGPGKPLRDRDPGDFFRTKSLPTMRTGCHCSSSASLPVAPIRPAHPSCSHTQVLRRRARCIRTLQLASEVSYSQLRVSAPVSPVSSRPAPSRVTPTGSCFPFQFRGQRLRVDPLTLHPPPLQARPCLPPLPSNLTQAPPSPAPPGAALPGLKGDNYRPGKALEIKFKGQRRVSC